MTTARSIACAAPVKERNFVAALKSSLIVFKIGQFKTFKSFKSVRNGASESDRYSSEPSRLGVESQQPLLVSSIFAGQAFFSL